MAERLDGWMDGRIDEWSGVWPRGCEMGFLYISAGEKYRASSRVAQVSRRWNTSLSRLSFFEVSSRHMTRTDKSSYFGFFVGRQKTAKPERIRSKDGNATGEGCGGLE